MFLVPVNELVVNTKYKCLIFIRQQNNPVKKNLLCRKNSGLKFTLCCLLNTSTMQCVYPINVDIYIYSLTIHDW